MQDSVIAWPADRRWPVTDVTLATFRAAGLRFAVPVERIQEVLGEQALEPVPRAPSAVAGLINLRGQILAAIDLRRRLGLSPRPPELAETHLIVRSGSNLESLVVDLPDEVVTLDDTTPAPVPDTIPSSMVPYLTAAHETVDSLVLVLDLDLVLAVAERGVGSDNDRVGD